MTDRRGVWLVVFLWFALALNYVDRQMVYSIYPALKSELHFSDPQLGLIGSIFAWVYSICMPFAGWLADRLRRDRMIVASMLLWSAATLACGLSASVAGFLSWRAVMGVTESLYYPAAVAMLAQVHAGATRSRALGIHQSAQLAGIVVGGWYGGWMADHWGWRVGFTIAAAAGVVYAAVLWRALPASAPPALNAVSNGFVTAVRLFRSSGYRALAIAFFAHCAMLWIFYAWLPSYLGERFVLSMTESGFQATVFVQVACGVGVVTGSVLADRLAKRIGAARFYIAAAGMLLAAPFGYLTFASESLTMATACSALYGYFAGLMIANVFAAATETVDAAQFELAAGVLNMIGGIAAGIMIYLAGALKSTLGFDGLLRWVAVACVVAALWLIRWARSAYLGTTMVSTGRTP